MFELESWSKSGPRPSCSKSQDLTGKTHGDNTGGNAEDAATALASDTVGDLITPIFQSAMNGFEKRNSTPVWTLAALKTKRGPSASDGKSWSVAPWNSTPL